jgi:N-acetylmuramoyl-L-alanine amidase
MAHLLLARFGVRARPRLLWSLPLIVAAIGIGCSSHRSSMRPVYVAPAPVPVSPCPTPAAVVVPSSPVVVPSNVGTYGAATEVPAAATPSGASPPPLSRPGVPSAEPGEPFLKPIDPDSSRVPEKPTSGTKSGTNGNGPPPSARLDGGRGRFASSSPTTQPSLLRSRVQPYVKDADDLFNPPKADRPWKYIVLHHSATESGGYDSIDHEHRKRLGWAGCGYHFVIGNGTESPDGAIEVAQRWRDQKLGVHCRDGKNPDINEYGIGICLVGDFEKNPPTPRQIAAAKALVTYLEARYKIPAERTETHAHLAASPTSCPGRMFPTEAILGNNAGLARR